MFDRLRTAMVGRNGIDHMAVALILCALILNLLTRIFSLLALGIASFVLMVLALLRVFSKKTDKRREQNEQFMRLWNEMKSGLSGYRIRRSQSKEFKFFACRECKCRLRVARGKGKVQITCPRCGLRFTGKT